MDVQPPPPDEAAPPGKIAKFSLGIFFVGQPPHHYFAINLRLFGENADNPMIVRDNAKLGRIVRRDFCNFIMLFFINFF
jgi:hypothetical protein